MTPEAEDGARRKAERGPMAVLSLMAVYLVLAVAVGVARGQMQSARVGAPGVFAAGAPFR
jgi:hypothetical protein